jgi:hypothetical protein
MEWFARPRTVVKFYPGPLNIMNIVNNKKVLDLIYTSITSEGGDGDALWLSKHTSLDDLASLIGEYDGENKTGWSIQTPSENQLLWGKDQEWAIITNDKDFFNNQPDWIILKIDY